MGSFVPRLEVNNVNPVLKQRVQEASKMI